MAVVVGSFLTGTLYTQFLLSRDSAALDMAYDAAPSMALLADARLDVRDIAHAAHEGRQDADARDRLTQVLARYQAMPFGAGEYQHYARVAPLIARLDALLAALGSPAPPSHMEIRAITVPLDNALSELSQLNRRKLETTADSMRSKIRHANTLALALDGGALLLAVLMTWLVLGTIEKLVATLDRRSYELEHLAVQVCHELANPMLPLQAALEVMERQTRNGPVQEALARAERSLSRIRGSIDKLLTFASSALPPSAPPPSTALRPVIAAVAEPLGLKVAVDAELEVACEEPVLREMVAQLLAVSMASAPLSLITEVHPTGRSVRIAVCCRYPGRAPSDEPFEAELLGVASGRPGIDLASAILRRRVETRDGRIGVWRAGHWRELFIELPRASAQADSAGPQ